MYRVDKATGNSDERCIGLTTPKRQDRVTSETPRPQHHPARSLSKTPIPCCGCPQLSYRLGTEFLAAYRASGTIRYPPRDS
nr:hypothetical protein CFP56_78733 [Quercus suber]